MANREERFGVMLDLIAEATTTEAPVVLDLCCRPGSLGARVLGRVAAARVVALDADPALHLLG